MFPVTSRYYNIEVAQLETRDGRTVRYLRRRFVPQAASLETFVEHVVIEGERLDHIAARYLGDPELYWRVCDANSSMKPEELTTEPGRILRIAMPDGTSGPRNA